MFGQLKSKIEVCLTESYKNKDLKKDLFIFEELVLKNKNISKIFFLYDELSSKKGLSESVANEYINESVNVYDNIVKNIDPKHIKELNMWVNHIVCENNYEHIDNIFTKNVLTIESKINSKKIIVESLKEVSENKVDIINVPLKSMINVANKTVNNFISNLTESEKIELKHVLSTPKKELLETYTKIKDEVVLKLNDKKSTSDEETSNTIDKVLSKLNEENFNGINYYKLRKLNEEI
jgi:hypothetical protein